MLGIYSATCHGFNDSDMLLVFYMCTTSTTGQFLPCSQRELDPFDVVYYRIRRVCLHQSPPPLRTAKLFEGCGVRKETDTCWSRLLFKCGGRKRTRERKKRGFVGSTTLLTKRRHVCELINPCINPQKYPTFIGHLFESRKKEEKRMGYFFILVKGGEEKWT